MTLPQQASAVIIGGGVIGASVAYHLAKQGWQDVVLLERKQFSCGTTWHAAGLVGTMRAHETQAKLCEYSMSLFSDIEKETGQSTGFRQVGSLSVAHTEARLEELKRVAAMNNAFGVTQVDIISPEEAKALYPLLNTDDLIGASWVAQDGVASPIDTTMAFIKGARMHGAQCLEGITVTNILSEQGKVTGVVTDQGDIKADFVVNCGGLWGKKIGQMAGVNVPLHACEHYYAVTEKLPGLADNLPVLRDHDNCVYMREDAGSLLVGAFEKKAIAWGQNGIPDSFCFDELEGHMESQLMPVLEAAMERIPMLQEAGWRTFFCGPESFTPDDQFHLGEAPELKNFYVACGLNSVGIQTSGGLGLALAEWMEHGEPTMDLWANDIRRMHPVQSSQAYLQERVTETLGLLYENHYPARQYASARGVRHSPIHERLVARNACFGELTGWERANWFAPEGVKPEYDYSFGKPSWFKYTAAEHQAARDNVVMFDQSSFSKYLVQGKDACACLQTISSANIDVPVGKIVYTHWLNQAGGIEADLTVTRLSETEFWVISAAATTYKDLHWLKRHIPENAHFWVSDITNSWAVFGIMGPSSRALLEKALKMDLSNDAFAFGQWQAIEVGAAIGRAFRVSFVGELGWELYIPVDQARHAFDYLMKLQEEFGLSFAGLHALDSCRIEKKFVHYGHDVGNEDTPLEAGLGFVCDLEKLGGFIGKEAILKQKEDKSWQKKRLIQFVLQDPDAMLYHHEPILQDGKIVGHLTSGNYGHTLGGSVGLGYVYSDNPINKKMIDNSVFEIDVAGERILASASLGAAYDPKALRMRS
ncbi:MAG: FAD-dependent oxidoreductase [Arenicellales bacterium]